ncbi:MAG: aminoacyl-histidine dipeptidase [Gemmatimonadota bacterium]|nr:aminoacyl-histidine dipeptidase [Gemmatimonadota bacterium]
MHEKTREILDFFEQIDSIPRCSKNEEKISKWLFQWGENHGFKTRADRAGNVVIEVPSTPGDENAPGIIIQGHMDMVCEKTPDSDHDFTKDPVRLVYEREWLTADKTTLGADNGIAIAMGLALALDKTVTHPPLELLFTVDEEQGLTGANKLEPGFIMGRILLNIDSEDEGVLTVGCSGGKETVITLPLSFSELPEDYCVCTLAAGGMRGGHSGIDIEKQRANANKLLSRVLYEAVKACGIRVISLKGGTAHNAIARDAEAVVACSLAKTDVLADIVREFEQTVLNEYASVEKSPFFRLSRPQDKSSGLRIPAVTGEDTIKAINLLLALPHGVKGMSMELEGLVETSVNLATVEIKDKALRILTSQRSAVMSKLDALTAEIEAIAALAGAGTESGAAYPAWQADMESPLLARCKRIYRDLYGRESVVEIIHAGLECAVIGARFPGMDMISLGPTIENPHSPEEKLHIPSIGEVWNFIVEILKSYCV